MKIIIVLGIILLIVIVITLLFISSKSKFTLLNIKIKEANSNINLFLQKKRVGLNSIIKTIKKKKKDEGKFDDFIQSVDNEADSFKLHALLNKYYSQVSKLLFDNEKLAKDKDIIKYLNELKNNDEDLIGSIKFYNDTIVDYNGLLKHFPHKVISRFLGYDELEFYKNEKEELFEILKDRS